MGFVSVGRAVADLIGKGAAVAGGSYLDEVSDLRSARPILRNFVWVAYDAVNGRRVSRGRSNLDQSGGRHLRIRA